MNNECRKVKALLSLYIDAALSSTLKMQVYNHLQICKSCKDYYLEFKKTEYLNSNISNFIRNNSPKLKMDFSKSVLNEIQSDIKYKRENIERSVITMIIALFLVTGFVLADRIIHANSSAISNNGANFEKLQESFYRACTKNFLY